MFQNMIFVEAWFHAQWNLACSAVRQACTTQKARRATLSTL